jgi:dCMP deaminase
MRTTRSHMLMEMACIAAERGTCERKRIGAILAVDGRPVSVGYNGAPSGKPHCLDVGCLIDPKTGGCIRTIHAELNAIGFAAREGIKTQGAILYTTISPCKSCADAIIAAGLTHVYYLEKYRVLEPLFDLEDAGVICIQLTRDPH